MEPSVFHAILGDPHYLWSPEPLDEVRRRLDRAPDLRGEIGSGTEAELLVAVGGQPNPLRPTLGCRLRPASGGTLLEVRYRLPMLPIALTIGGMIFIGPATLILLILGFYYSKKSAQQLLVDAIEPTETGRSALDKLHQTALADPTEPGSSANAPQSFRVEAQMNSARFSVGGQSSGRQALTIQSAGVQLEGQLLMDWADLHPIEIHTDQGLPMLLLRTAESAILVPIGQHSQADQRWLVDHLNAHRNRRALSEEHRLRAEADRKRLASLQR